ncbi:unnamed protein product [Staurois parvus]|uniref:Uncharacterized protein n=1 Tax=Staurois parvus TaxID=386267 RepID=A0ABN9B3N8_9NEOB|nr:unnamed protein product [Staurois parvus]
MSASLAKLYLRQDLFVSTMLQRGSS